METVSPLTVANHAGYPCLHLSTNHGLAIISLHGGHLVSWIPKGQRDVFWLSPQALPQPNAIRGGVPVCWPWFAKQEMPDGAMQHGPVRNAMWRLTAVNAASPERVEVSLSPAMTSGGSDPVARYAAGLELNLNIVLTDELTQTLVTTNSGPTTRVLTQALHSYFAVGNAQSVHVDGLQGAHYTSRLDALGLLEQTGDVTMGDAIDRTYLQSQGQKNYSYRLVDPVWKRVIEIETTGSRSMVLWNPGALTAKAMADVPAGGWRDFFCLESTNAGEDRIQLVPGGIHTLRQVLRCMASPR